MKECLAIFHAQSRYAVHGKIDSLFKKLAQGASRAWHIAVVAIAASIRTDDQRVIDMLPQPWNDVPALAVGQMACGYLEFVPHKPKHFTAFRTDDDYAVACAASRLQASGAYEDDVRCELQSRSLMSIDKSKNAYSAPSAWMNVSGTVKDPLALDNLMMRGIGGSRTFGVGKLIMPSSPLWAAAFAVA
jgi:hypothetical protein